MQIFSKLNRRRALLLLTGAILPAAAYADEVSTPLSPTPTPTTPTLPGGFRLPIPVTSPSATPAPSAATTASSLGPIDKTKAYFIYFQRSIDLISAKALRTDLVALVEGGVTDITLVINSPGGLLAPSLQLYSLIRSLPAKIKTHGQGIVASAANLLMLAGENRTADSTTRFFFHPSQSPIIGTFNSVQFDDQVLVMREYENMLADIYRERTKIPEGDIDRFKHGSVPYDAAKALEYGVIHKIHALEIPSQKAKLVFVD